MSENFGLKIGLEGEKEFKKSLAEINNSFKVLGSEMKLVDSQFDKNDNPPRHSLQETKFWARKSSSRNRKSKRYVLP